MLDIMKEFDDEDEGEVYVEDKPKFKSKRSMNFKKKMGSGMSSMLSSSI